MMPGSAIITILWQKIIIIIICNYSNIMYNFVYIHYNSVRQRRVSKSG
jgi:hypothetical protein